MEGDDSKSNSKWIEYAKNLAVILGVLLAVKELIAWIPSSEPLQGAVAYGPFALPEIVKQQIHSNREAIEKPKLLKLIHENPKAPPDPKTKAAIQDAVDDIANGLREAVPLDLPSGAESLSTIMRIELTNNGKVALDEVELFVPFAKFAQINRDNEDSKFVSVRKDLSIGKLQAQEVVHVTVWCSGGDLTDIYSKQIRATHSKGLADIAVRRPVGAVAQFINDWQFPILIAIFCVAGGLAAGLDEFLKKMKKVSSAKPVSR
jgi:hypothetical protein